MLTEIFAIVFSVAVSLVGLVRHPQTATCPPGWYVRDGVRTQAHDGRPSGAFACQRPWIGGESDLRTGQITAVEQPGRITGRVYCATGAGPTITNSSRTVACRQVRS